ncbi:MAG: hypothetical protein ACE5JM_14140, partial [Armatimonadota bacterium]
PSSKATGWHGLLVNLCSRARLRSTGSELSVPPGPTLAALALAIVVLPCVALAQGGKPKALLFRGTHYFLVSAQADETIHFTIDPYIPAKYATKRPEVQLVSADGTTLLSRRGIDARFHGSARAVQAGYCALRVRGFRDWYQVRFTNRPFAVFHSQLQPLHITGAARPLYFTVPADARRFRVYVQCDSPNEGAIVRVLAPTAEVVLEKTDQFDPVTPLDVPVPPGQAGKIWAVELANPRLKGEGYGLDDTVIFFSENIPPVVSPDREALAQISEQLGPDHRR